MAHSKWISPLLRQLPGLRWRAGPESDEVFPRTDQIGRQDSTKTVALYCLSMLHYLKIQVFEGTSRSPDRWTISSRFEKTPGSSQILCPPFFFPSVSILVYLEQEVQVSQIAISPNSLPNMLHLDFFIQIHKNGSEHSTGHFFHYSILFQTTIQFIIMFNGGFGIII